MLYKSGAAGQEPCANAARDKGLNQSSIKERGAAESCGGEKKPVLISCGLVFPAGMSAERERGGCSCGVERSVKPKKCHSHYFSLPLSLCLFIFTHLSPFFLPTPVHFYPTFSSSHAASFPHVQSCVETFGAH